MASRSQLAEPASGIRSNLGRRRRIEIALRRSLCVFFLPTFAGATCWIGGYSRDFCCDPEHGPQGNAACWDDVFQYDRCCLPQAASSSSGDSGADADTDADFGLPDGGALEQALRPKLLQILADGNGTSPAEFEAHLRAAIASPENRTISRRDAVAFLVVLLRIQGRHEDASRALREQRVAENLEVSASGTWVGTDAEGYHMHDRALAEALITFFRSEGANTVGDFGCGLGLYVRDFRAAGLRAGGFDGNPSTAVLSGGRCQVADLSSTLDFGTRWDWVMSLEVAEHIPRDYEGEFLNNLDRHARRGLVLSWGNQAGHGHVNLRSRSEVESLLQQRGFRSISAPAATLRAVATLPWFQETILVFVRSSAVE